MKVLFIQDSLGTGGAERSNAELWYYLRSRGVDIKILVLEHRKEGIEKEILAAGFNVVFLKPGSFFNHVLQIRKSIVKFNPDLVHSVLFKSALRTRFTKLLLNFRNVESLVNCTYAKIRYSDPKINSGYLKLIEKLDKFSARFGVDHFIAITQEVADHYRTHLNLKKEKISIISRGRKENTYLEQRDELRSSLCKKLGLDSNKPIFIHVGRQEFQKAHIDILKAIMIADDSLSTQGVQFLFCGRNGNASELIDEFLNDHKLKTRISFLGHRSDIYKLLVASDVFVFPSLFEGLGGSLIEAQAAGLPIICSDIPVFQEVITDRNSLIHRANDAKSLAGKLMMILNEDLKKMGEASLNNYYEKFQLAKINSQVYDLYHNLISKEIN